MMTRINGWRPFLPRIALVWLIGANAVDSAEISCVVPLSDASGDPGTVRILKSPFSPQGGILVEVDQPQSNRRLSLLQSPDGRLAWSTVGDTDTGPVLNFYDFGDAGLLVAGQRGLFTVTLDAAGGAVNSFNLQRTGAVRDAKRVQGVGLFVATDNGLFLIKKVGGQLRLEEPQTQLPQFEKRAQVRLEELPGLGWLIDFQTGEYFLAQVSDGKLSIRKATFRSAGFGGIWGQTYEVPGLGVLINDPTSGVSLAHMVDGEPQIESIGEQVIPGIQHALWVSELGLFIDTGYTSLLAKLSRTMANVELASRTATGVPQLVYELKHRSGKLLATSKGLFFVDLRNGEGSVSPVDVDGIANAIEELPGGGAMLATSKGLKLVEIHGDSSTSVFSIDNPRAPSNATTDNIGGLTMIRTEGGYFESRLYGPNPGIHTIYPTYQARAQSGGDVPKAPGPIGPRPISWLGTLSNGEWLAVGDDTVLLVQYEDEHFQLSWVSEDKIGHLQSVHELTNIGWLIAGSKGLFVARVNDNEVHLEQLNESAIKIVGELQPVQERRSWLIAGEEALYYIHPTERGLTADSVAGPIFGKVTNIQRVKELGWLIGTEKGLFLVRQEGDRITTELVGKSSIGKVGDVQQIGTAGWLLDVDGRMFVASQALLSSATVTALDGRLYGNPPEGDLDSPIDFAVQHVCASTLQQASLAVELTPPVGRTIDLDSSRLGNFNVISGKVTFTARLPIHTPGTWRLQFLLHRGSARQPVGPANEITFSSDQTLKERYEKLGASIAIVLAAFNLLLFVAARRSALAWRLATDDSISTATFRVVTLAMSHFPWAQLWILDLYFSTIRRGSGNRSPFLPLPLIRGDGQRAASELVTAPSWRRRRLWIQGNSGMGKSALFRHLTEEHFQESVTAYDAYRTWGCVFVAFSARDFALGGDDEIKPDWVIEAVRMTLSQRELTFEDDKLLRRLLRSGVIGVVIDGLHEAGRAKAVEAFASAFPAAPMLVTSQESGSLQFENYRLPPDMREFTYELLKVYLNQQDSDVVMERIVRSGLNESIRSGYDVRLIIDIVRSDPRDAPLPNSRMGLYEAVVKAGWPDGSADLVQQQLERTAAAAWRVVSERKPNEDKRRFVPDADLAADLLDAIADAPERDGRPVRLMRRVGKVFEFVHDQMHAYLAARWFTQTGFTSQELERMTAASSIWADSAPARRTLWGFVAGMLDDERLISLWHRVEEQDDWDILRRELKREAKARGRIGPE